MEAETKVKLFCKSSFKKMLFAMVLLSIVIFNVHCSVKGRPDMTAIRMYDCVEECYRLFDEECFSCHTNFKKLGKPSRMLHTPVEQKDCSGCHTPHDSKNVQLLRRPYPRAFYLPYKAENYALCFNCHNSEIGSEPKTSRLTKFRNGEINLHYAHVNKKPKGLNCKLCHDMHSGRPPISIPLWWGSIPEFMKPFKYTRNETGGGCEVSCHKELTRYDRIKPVEY
jgi:predicted CXXCH cytochrome family protein